MGEERGKAGSPALLAAQQKLQRLREQFGVLCNSNPAPNPCGRSSSSTNNYDHPDHRLPDHLGWGSARLTQAIKIAQSHRAKGRSGELVENLQFLQPTASDCPALRTNFKSRDGFVKLYPDLALGMLKEKQEALGRIWLLLQYLDEKGCGWIDVQAARRQLTEKDSPLRACGRRQWRKLLARGEGLFWRRNQGRIWLRSTAKVAASLGVRQLTGRPIALPTGALLQGIGAVRAHFYASFHSGRNHPMLNARQSKPISRATLQEICHVSRRTQRRYEKRAAVGQQCNFAIGKTDAEDEFKEQAWRRGRAVFRFTDHKAKLGQKGKIYTAWQLPNSYVGPHEQRPKGRQKRLNRKLADLFTKGMTGNGDESVQGVRSGIDRFFYDHGFSAAVGYNRSPHRDLYWRSRLRQRDHYQIWHVLPGKRND